MDAADELARALAARSDVDVTELVRRAETGALADAEAILRRLLTEDLLRRAAAHAAGDHRVLALVGVTDGVQPLVRELAESALRDEHRLERELRTHNELLLEAMSRSAVIPFRFGTAFADEEQLQAWLGEHHDVLALELERLRGKAEWSIEAFVPRAEREPGEYLRERLAVATRPDVRARLASVSAEAAGDAYLVEDSRRSELEELVASLEEEGYELAISGPWPPYSFARLP